MAANAEKSEMLVAYDENLNPIGVYPRSEIHEKSMLHKTIRLWMIDDENNIWFQRRALNKSLFPGKYDMIATGHVNPGETPLMAMLREMKEETGLELDNSDLIHAGDIPFPFMRPDGHVDNEYASIYIYRTGKIPCLQVSDEVIGFASVSIQDYTAIVRTHDDIHCRLRTYASGMSSPVETGISFCSKHGFCCPKENELDLVLNALSASDRK